MSRFLVTEEEKKRILNLYLFEADVELGSTEALSSLLDKKNTGEKLVAAYEKDPECAKEWFKSNTKTSLITNIESVIKTGKDKKEIENLGTIYDESDERKKVVESFIKFQTECSAKKGIK